MKLSKLTIGILAGSAGTLALLGGGAAVVAHNSWHDKGWSHHRAAVMDAIVDELDHNADGAISRVEADTYQTARFAAMDTDGNGELTPREVSDGLRMILFEKLDADGDGQVAQSEFMAFAGDLRMGSRGFGRIDGNGDGRVDTAELNEKVTWMFSHLDEDENGIIDREELDDIRGGRHHR